MTYNKNIVIMIPDRRCGMDERERKGYRHPRADVRPCAEKAPGQRCPENGRQRLIRNGRDRGERSSRARRRRRNTIIRWRYLSIVLIACGSGWISVSGRDTVHQTRKPIWTSYYGLEEENDLAVVINGEVDAGRRYCGKDEQEAVSCPGERCTTGSII